MLRFIKELFRPSLKCARVGHNVIKDVVRVRIRSSSWREVVADYSATIERCKRCGHKEPPVVGEKITGYTGCEMPSEMWDELDKNGYLIK